MIVRLKSIEEIVRDDSTASFDGKDVTFSDGKLPIISNMLKYFDGREVHVKRNRIHKNKLNLIVNNQLYMIYDSFIDRNRDSNSEYIEELFKDILGDI